MKKLKFILSALMLTVCMSAFIGAGGATAFAYEGEQEPVAVIPTPTIIPR